MAAQGRRAIQVQEWGQHEAEEGLGQIQGQWGDVEKVDKLRAQALLMGCMWGRGGATRGPEHRHRPPLRPGVHLRFYGVGIKLPTDPNRS